MTLSRILTAALAAAVMVSGCGSPPTTTGTPTAAPAPQPTTVVQFDPQWMSLSAPASWRETDRRITGEFQQFGLRPLGEGEPPRRCNGCGEDPPTAFLTAYAPGKFDPTGIRAADPVSVAPGTDGFYLASRASEDAVLAWEYAEDSWATVRGRTSTTSEPDRMLQLARALRPAERTAVGVPLSIPNVPPPMELAEVTVVRERFDLRDILATLTWAPDPADEQTWRPIADWTVR